MPLDFDVALVKPKFAFQMFLQSASMVHDCSGELLLQAAPQDPHDLTKQLKDAGKALHKKAKGEALESRSGSGLRDSAKEGGGLYCVPI